MIVWNQRAHIPAGTHQRPVPADGIGRTSSTAEPDRKRARKPTAESVSFPLTQQSLRSALISHKSRALTMTDHAPSISVCMPVYNSKRYVAAAIESILNQTLGDFEFLILDDGSTDGSMEILERYAARDSRIRLWNRPNKGLAPTMNELLDEAQGEFIARMDSDDISLPDRFELQATYLRANPDCVLVGGQAMVIDPDGDPLCVWFQGRTHEELDAHNLLGNRGTALCHPSIMMRRQMVMEIGKYREQFRIGEDLDLFLRLAEIGRISNLPQVLIKYRAHESNFTRTRERAAYEDLGAIVANARERRGLPAERFSPPCPPQTVAKSTSHETWGWQALTGGNVTTARKHASKAVLDKPLSRAAWRLFYCALRGR